MNFFRSPLLKALPKGSFPDRARTIKKRFWLTILSGSLLAFPAYMALSEQFPKQGVTYWFYWVHDAVWLPLKGYGYRWFYPASLVWCGLTALAFCFWLIFFLAGGSSVRAPHRALLGWVVRQRGLRHYLPAAARFLLRFRCRPGLMAEVTRFERDRLLDRLATTPGAPASGREEIAELTALLVDLEILPGAPPAHHLRAALYWREAFMALRRRHPGAPYLTMLTGRLPALMRPFFDPTKGGAAGAIGVRAGFDIPSLLVDVLFLGALADQDLAQAAGGPDLAGKPVDVVEAWVARRLATSAWARCRLLDEARLQAEIDGLRTRSASPRPAPPVPLPAERTGAEGHVLARLALGLAMDHALLSGSTAAASALMDSMETLRLALSLADPDGQEDAAVLADWDLFLGDLPGPEAYHLCAEIRAEQLRRRRLAWQKSALGDILQESDFLEAGTAIASLYHAADPEMAISGGNS